MSCHPTRPPSPPGSRFPLKGFLGGVILLLAVGSSSDPAPTRSLPHSVVPCDPCHRGGESNQVGEWLASPYSATEGGLGCTHCHRRPCRGNPSVEPVGRAGPSTGTGALRAAARLSVKPVCAGDVIAAEVAVANVGVGHLLPTGPAGRRLTLEVTARDADGAPLRVRTGSVVSTGAGGTLVTAGKEFARGSQRVVSVTRSSPLAPFATDVSEYHFAAPVGLPAQVTARLVLVPINGEPEEISSTTAFCPNPGEAP